MFCRSLFVLLSFLFRPLCFLFFYDLRILITLLVSSNSSFIVQLFKDYNKRRRVNLIHSCTTGTDTCTLQGRIQDFKLGGALKKLRRAEGVFRVKNHDFTPKNHIFPILGGRAKYLGYFMWKITILRLASWVSRFRLRGLRGRRNGQGHHWNRYWIAISGSQSGSRQRPSCSDWT